jgi:uncharacterized protein involved in exopolysaccharide biosynthesis
MKEIPGETTRAAVRALAQRLTVRRPERTFIIEIGIASRDPAKAARIANAVAHAFIEVQSVLYAQSARDTSTVFTARLEGLRHQLLDAERQVEEFKAKNGLVGAREQLVSDQQLRDINQQLTLARVRTEDAKARSQQVQQALRQRGDLGPLTERLNLGTVTALRGRVAEAQRQLADLSSDLGPLHPAVKKAQSVLADAKKAMDTESKRIADSFRRDYERAAAAQAAIEGNLAAAQQLTITNNETAVRLRDLEREADATRTLYESFLNRAWRTGEAPNIDGTSTHIVSMAVPPKDRASPPGGLVSMIAGALAGERPIDWLFCDGPNEIAGPGLARFFDSMDDIVLVITQHDHAMDEIAALRRELGRNAEKIAACVVLDTAIFALKGVIANADHDITSAAARADYLDLPGRLGDPALPAETPTAMPTLVAEAA